MEDCMCLNQDSLQDMEALPICHKFHPYQHRMQALDEDMKGRFLLRKVKVVLQIHSGKVVKFAASNRPGNKLRDQRPLP